VFDGEGMVRRVMNDGMEFVKIYIT